MRHSLSCYGNKSAIALKNERRTRARPTQIRLVSDGTTELDWRTKDKSDESQHDRSINGGIYGAVRPKGDWILDRKSKALVNVGNTLVKELNGKAKYHGSGFPELHARRKATKIVEDRRHSSSESDSGGVQMSSEAPNR